MSRIPLAGAVFALALATSSAMAQQAPKPGELTDAAFTAQTCALCHGTPSQTPPTMPLIYGSNADQLYTTLLDLKANRRPSTIMGRIARGFTDDQLKAVADYLARY